MAARRTVTTLFIALACAGGCARLRKPTQSLGVVVLRPKLASADARWLAHAVYFTLAEKLQEIEGLDVAQEASRQPPSLPRPCRLVATTCRVEGGRFAVELEATDPATGAAVLRRTIAGSEEELPETIARLAEAVVEALNTRVILWDGQPFARPAPPEDRLVLSRWARSRLRRLGTDSPRAFVAFWKAVAGDAPRQKSRWLATALASDPDYPRPYLVRGILRHRAGQDGAAVEDLRHALRLGLRTPELFYTLGLALSELGELDEAVEAYGQALALRPTDPAPLIARALARVRQGREQQAIEDATRAIELAPSLPAAHVARGRARVAAGDVAGGTADFTAALKLEPDCLDAWLQRACARQRSGHHAEAIADFTRALSLDPDNPLAFRGRGLSRYARGDHKGAIADFTRAIARQPQQPLAYYGRALALCASGDYKAALEDALAARKRGATVPEDLIGELKRRASAGGGRSP